MTKVSIPLRRNCRVDYKRMGESTFSVLVDYMNEDRQLYYEAGVKQLNELYEGFKFSVTNKLPIENYPFSAQISISKLENAIYTY